VCTVSILGSYDLTCLLFGGGIGAGGAEWTGKLPRGRSDAAAESRCWVFSLQSANTLSCCLSAKSRPLNAVGGGFTEKPGAFWRRPFDVMGF
jgi:hypothetical protein